MAASMNPTESSQVIYEVSEGIAQITLNRPDKLNSLSGKMHHDLRWALDCIDQGSNIRVVIIKGAGKGFCSGQDLRDPDLKFDKLSETLEFNYNPLIKRLTSMKQIVIASVHGVAAGAGSSLALSADLTVASKSSLFIQAFIKIGLIPDAGGTWFLSNKIGLQKAMGLALTGDSITGEQADELGLIWKSFEDQDLETETLHLAKQLAKMPGYALTEIKKAIYLGMHNTLDQQLALESQMQNRLGQTPDFREGVDAFLNKRPAKFNAR